MEQFFKKTIVFNSVIAFIFLICFILILLNLSSPDLLSLDQNANSYMTGIHNSFLTFIAQGLSYPLESNNVIIAISVIAVIIWLKGAKKDCLFLSLTSLTAGILLYILKILVKRDRPVNALIEKNDFSFPSGHAFVSVVFYSFFLYLTLKYIKSGKKYFIIIPAILLIFLTGLSRVYLNVHWCSDVIAGFCLGVSLFAISLNIFGYKDALKK
jgi:undecaprenyl-diphosphatase